MLEKKEICVVSGFLKLNSLERGFQRAAAPGGPLSLFFLHRNARILLNQNTPKKRIKLPFSPQEFMLGKHLCMALGTVKPCRL